MANGLALFTLHDDDLRWSHSLNFHRTSTDSIPITRLATQLSII